MFTIFEKVVSHRHPSHDLFIRLYCEDDIGVSQSIPLRLEIQNEFGMASPIVSVKFRDARGDLFNLIKFQPTARFRLEFGRSTQDSLILNLNATKIDYVNLVAGRPHDIVFHVDFIIDNWYEFISKRHNRGWYQTPFSDIASEILEESGFTDVAVTESEHDEDELDALSVIQPHWTNFNMVKWIMNKSKPSESIGWDGHYEFGVRLDGEAWFRSINDVIKEKENDIRSKSLPILRLNSHNLKPDNADSAMRSNKNVAPFFVTFSGEENYVDNIIHGAGGFVSAHWDWDSGEYITEEVKFSESEVPQLSDLSSIMSDHEDNLELFFTGRDKRSKYDAEIKTSREAIRMQKFKVATEGTRFLDLFDIIELYIPNTTHDSTEQVNTMYGGVYMISGYHHIFNLGDNVEHTMSVSLSRHGIDDFGSQDLSGYATSGVGKI